MSARFWGRTKLRNKSEAALRFPWTSPAAAQPIRVLREKRGGPDPRGEVRTVAEVVAELRHSNLRTRDFHALFNPIRIRS